MNKKTENLVRSYFLSVKTEIDKGHLQKVIHRAQNEQITRCRQKRIGFPEFCLRQVKYTAWKIWAAQGSFLIVMCSIFLAVFGSPFDLSHKQAAILLGLFTSAIPLISFPFLYRSVRYRMHEVEEASRFASLRLLASKLLIICTGDAFMLAGATVVSIVKMNVNAYDAILYGMLPFLAVSSLLLYIVAHVPSSRAFIYFLVTYLFVLSVGAVLVHFCTFLFSQSLSWITAGICMILSLFCASQIKKLLQGSTYQELQLI